jgi:transcriptional regulator with XRE-family HTH domain
MEHFGERLRRLRADRSQKAIAESLGIPQTTLSSLENQKSVPRGDVLNKIAAFFAVPVTYFYSPADPEPSEGAKAWLQQLKNQDIKGRETVATHSSLPVDSATRKAIAAKLKQKSDEDQ